MQIAITIICLTVLFHLFSVLPVFGQGIELKDFQPSIPPSPNPSLTPLPTTTPTPSFSPSPSQSPTPPPAVIKSCSDIWVHVVRASNQGFIFIGTTPQQLLNPDQIPTKEAPSSEQSNIATQNLSQNTTLLVTTTAQPNDITLELAKLGCMIGNIGAYTASSPLIHIYSPNKINISIKFTDQNILTYADTKYSYLSGFELSDFPKSVYYEFIKELLNKELENIKSREVVSGTDLKKYLINYLIPQLKLTDTEINEFIKKDIDPQLELFTLSDLKSTNFEIFLLQTPELNKLIPLQITPPPNNLYRNMIIVKKTNRPPTNSLIKINHLNNREELTIIENGFAVLGN